MLLDWPNRSDHISTTLTQFNYKFKLDKKSNQDFNINPLAQIL